jgi:hypothetical protein
MHVQSTHRLTLAPDVLAAERITLLTPGGGKLVLRAVSRAP